MMTPLMNIREVPRAILEEGGSLLWVLGFFGLVVVICIVQIIVTQIKVMGSPLRTVSAVVTKKRTGETTYHNTNSSDIRKSSSHRTYFVTFLLDDGEEVELIVPHISAMGIRIGDRGELTYRGPKYYAFD